MKSKNWNSKIKNLIRRMYQKKYKYDFRSILTKRLFGDRILNCKIILSEADKKESSLLRVILDFNSKFRQRSKADKKEKMILMKT